MGFDYFPRIDCAIQLPRDDREFVQRAKTGEYAAQMTALIEQEEDPERRAKMQESITLPFPVKTLMGARAQLSYEELIETWERIERKSLPICRDCPLNHKGRALGCWGAISYPISQAGERWLIDRFNPPEPGPSYLLHHIIKEAELDGRQLDSARAEVNIDEEGGGRLPLLLPPGPAEKWIDGERISSSMIIEYLLVCQPTLLPITLFGMLEDLEAIEVDGMTRMVLQMALSMGIGDKEEAIDQIRFTLPEPTPDEDRSVIQIKRFLKACYLALRHKGKMCIDG